MFRETVLQIEGENVSAVDVVYHLDELRGNLMLQKEDRYLAPPVKAERKKMMDDDESGFEDVIFQDYTDHFFGKFDTVIYDTHLFQFFFFFSLLRYHEQLPE